MRGHAFLQGGDDGDWFYFDEQDTRTLIKTRTALYAAYDRIEELEESLAGKQLALDKVISENDGLQRKLHDSKVSASRGQCLGYKRSMLRFPEVNVKISRGQCLDFQRSMFRLPKVNVKTSRGQYLDFQRSILGYKRSMFRFLGCWYLVHVSYQVWHDKDSSLDWKRSQAEP